MKRFGQVVKVRPEKYEVYKSLHENCWPEIIEAIQEANVRNFTIFHRDGYLFKYFEYVGDDYEADMKKLAENPKNIAWLSLTDPCQEAFPSAEEGKVWTDMDELFHL